MLKQNSSSSKSLNKSSNKKAAKNKSSFANNAKVAAYKISLFILGMLATGLFIFCVVSSIPHIKNLLTIKAIQIWPTAYDPVARFVANMDWSTNTMHLDASMSKAFEDKIEKYIWRIDDGTSLVAGEKLDHKFDNPGYYYIQLSIVDQNQQSDVATCQVLIPPTEVEKVVTRERLESSKNDSSVEDTNYIWAPVGTFYNYSKLAAKKQTYSALKSRYVNSDCGLSNRGYNIGGVSNNLSHKNRSIRKSVANLIMYTTGMVVTVGLFVLVKKGLEKELAKIIFLQS